MTREERCGHKKNRRPHRGDGGSNQRISRASWRSARGAFIDHKPCSNRENMFMASALQADFLTRILSQDAFPSAFSGQWHCVLGIPGTAGSDAHSGATVADFHRVPFSPIPKCTPCSGTRSRDSFSKNSVIVGQMQKNTSKKCGRGRGGCGGGIGFDWVCFFVQAGGLSSRKDSLKKDLSSIGSPGNWVCLAFSGRVRASRVELGLIGFVFTPGPEAWIPGICGCGPTWRRGWIGFILALF
jgi:hypothetical protein